MDDFWQQVDNEERRRYEEEVVEAQLIAERDEWERKFNNNRPWFHVIDQDEGWIARITK